MFNLKKQRNVTKGEEEMKNANELYQTTNAIKSICILRCMYIEQHNNKSK